MPTRQPSARPLAQTEVPDRIIRKVTTALATGRGIAVLPLHDLLLDPFEDDIMFLGVDRAFAFELHQRTAYVIGRSGANYLPPLPLHQDSPVLLYSDGLGTKPTALLKALNSWVTDGENDPSMASAQALADALRSLVRALPPRPRTQR